ncbi:lytic transglycosylase domain-containing protein [Methylobacterium planeticum]|uniref:Lytic transglycosylase domain-containing protein n=1 Tax=Methylobacterium planeticum TaxID=2615211 RepID=A0A6N6MU18_9HYPH|nr:lytic transglycosylase domain-containing protein [Methylobacterium planeticum]KAB1074218.1 lytic transglycosylase domain-containing protein [Methylobacterium planeticum]
MFLFTTPSANPRETGPNAVAPARSAGATAVVEAIRDGAQSTGVGFDYLLATAQRESALDPAAKAATSSATGLFQFIDQTWLGVMKTAGPKLGLSDYADAITTRPDGTYTVSDTATRQTILDLRRDPKIASTLAGALTQKNREALSASLGREPTSGDLYAAHVLGARGATTLIGSAQASPARAAALDLPDAAAANRGLFYDRAGRPRTSAELYATLSTAAAGGRPGTAAATDVTALPQGTSAYAAIDGGGLRALFQTDRRQGAISDGVAKLWQGRSAGDGERSAPTYFPRSDEGADPVTETGAIANAAPANGTPTLGTPTLGAPILGAPILGAPILGAPLPPRRPAEFTAGRSAAGPRAGTPLDLSLFTIRSGP